MIISIFSPIWFVLAAGVVLSTVIAGRRLRKLDRLSRLKRLMWASIGVSIFWVLYKTVLAFDKDYSFILLDELPLHLCNIGTVLAIFAAKRDSRPMQAFLFYVNLLGAVTACFTPESAFIGVSVFTPRCIGFWGYHCALTVLCLSFVSSGVYKPVLGDIPRALMVLFGVVLLAFAFNLLLRATISPQANYCFSFGFPGNPLTQLLQKYIPIPFIYMLPLFIPIALIDVLLERITALVLKVKHQ